MSLNKVERESFLKSFTLFFLSLSILATFLIFSDYKIAKEELSNTILSEMRVCSYNLECPKYDIDFVKNDNFLINQLQENKHEHFAYFPIEQSYDFTLKLSYKVNDYEMQIETIVDSLIFKLSIILLSLGVLSILFSIYALYPLRQALHLSKEFARDILHDFNTPLSVIRLNASLLQESQNNKKIMRIQNGVDTMLMLQDNLRSYLDDVSTKSQKLDLAELVQTRVELMEKLFINISFSTKLQSLDICTNSESMTRVIDNLLNNAAKYNKTDGKITLTLLALEKKLIIEDTGVGIENPKEVFKRFYTENKNGVGIGLHIVKKLCDTMHIKIKLQSSKEGSTFELDLEALTKC